MAAKKSISKKKPVSKKGPAQEKSKAIVKSKAITKTTAPEKRPARKTSKSVEAAPAKRTVAKKKTATPKKTATLKKVTKLATSKTALVNKAAKAKTKTTPTPVEELPTEEIWGRYQKVRKAGKEGADELELIRNVLMERHYPLVKYIAERLLQTLPKSIELDDLISAGLFGLMDAIRGFDPERGIKFKTYCTTRIRGSILDQLRSQDWVPRLVRLKAGKIDKALQRLTGEYGREPTHAELASTLEMDHTELSKEISSASAKAMYSLSDKWEDRDDDSSMEKVDVLEDKKSTDPIGELNRADMMNYITRSLTHKERFIIEQYYQVGHTMREIGEMLSLTESRVCQIHSNVMARLKSMFGSKQTTLLM